MWKSLFKELPLDKQIVFIRVLNQYGEFAQAQWSEKKQTFTTTLTGIVIPAYQVSRWRAL